MVELHYIAHIMNVPSILERGILPNNKMHNVPHQSVANPSVQARRKLRKIADKPLHDFVNLYFDAHNPMLSAIRSKNNDICVLAVDPCLMKFPGVVITDMNAAADLMRPYSFPEGLSILDKDALYATNWKHPEDEVKDRIHGQIKCAEVLVPNGVNARFIRHAYVVNELGLKAFEKFGVQLRVEIKSGMFFPV